MEEFKKYAVKMGSGALIYIPGFLKIGSGIQKLMGGGYTDIHSKLIGGYTDTQTAW
jgi:hypothetical protein